MKKIILFLSIGLFIFTSCLNEVSEVDYERSNNKVYKKARNVDGFDLKPFIDVTMKNVNANDITINDFEGLCSGQYFNNKKGSSITVNKSNHTVSFNVSNIRIKGTDYNNIYIKYEYKIKAASKNLIYLCPLNMNEVDTNLNKDVLKNLDLCMSLYGFGEGRIECSNHLDGISYIPCGTYWKR